MARFRIRVQPRASANEVAGRENDVVRVRLTAPPVEGKANKALIDFLAERLGVSKSAVTIVSGHGARNKLVEVNGLEDTEIARRLGIC